MTTLSEMIAPVTTGVDIAAVEAKLLHMLDVYPSISPSMLQIAMNPLKAGDWRPSLEKLISTGRIRRLSFTTTSSVGRSITYTLIQALDPHKVLNDLAVHIAETTAPTIPCNSEDPATE